MLTEAQTSNGRTDAHGHYPQPLASPLSGNNQENPQVTTDPSSRRAANDVWLEAILTTSISPFNELATSELFPPKWFKQSFLNFHSVGIQYFLREMSKIIS